MEVKMLKAPGIRITFGRPSVEKVHCVVATALRFSDILQGNSNKTAQKHLRIRPITVDVIDEKGFQCAVLYTKTLVH